MADNTNHYSTYSPQDRSLRASDDDREAIGDFLRRQHVAGRLDADEFADRYGRCLEAKTYAQLDGLITDLPFDGRAATSPVRPLGLMVRGRPEVARGAAPVAGPRVRLGDPVLGARRRWPRLAMAGVPAVLLRAATAHLALCLAGGRPWPRVGTGGPWGGWGCRSGFAGPGGPTV